MNRPADKPAAPRLTFGERLIRNSAVACALLLTLMKKRLHQERQKVASLASSRSLKSPGNYLADRRMLLDYTHRRLSAASLSLLNRKREKFVALTSKLDAMSPLKVLSRGYSIALDDNGAPVRSVKALVPGDRLTLRLSDGAAITRVEEITNETAV